MRLSIREEVAYNRKVTELREKAMAEAIAEVEKENMLVEMEEYLAMSADESEKKKTTAETLSEQEVFDNSGMQQCMKNDEICIMLDDLEKTLLVENPDFSSVPVPETEKDEGPTGTSVKMVIEDKFLATREEGLSEHQERESDTCGETNNECIKLKEPGIERLVTEENISLHVSDVNGNEYEKIPKRRYLSIFTRRRKNKSQQVTENKPLTSSEKMTDRRSFLDSLKNFFCCYRPEK